jgi:hypothetical protein
MNNVVTVEYFRILVAGSKWKKIVEERIKVKNESRDELNE